MDSQLLPTTLVVLAAAAAASVRGNSEVMESSVTYYCCRSLPFSQSCDSTWTLNLITFAYALNGGTQTACTSPCEHLQGGQMTLDTCRDVNVTTVCTEMNTSVEKRIHYKSQACPESRSNAAGLQAHFALLLLTVVIDGGFVKEMLA